MNFNKIVKILFIISIVINLIVFLPVVLSFIFLIRDRDAIINYREYNKKTIDIDSLRFGDINGGDLVWVYGYSKELDNYKTTILFNSVKEKDFRSKFGMDKNGRIIRDVWLREKYKYAYPANKSDKIFPIKTFLYNHLRLPLFWIVSILVSILFYRIVKKTSAN